MTAKFAWDGKQCLDDVGLGEWIEALEIKPGDTDQTLEASCNLFSFEGCCVMYLDGERIESGVLCYDDGRFWVE